MAGWLALALVLVARAQADAEAPMASIRGAVVSAAGRPAGSVWVLVLQGTREAGRTVTADDGRYYVGRLSPGSYTVLVKRGKSILYRGQVTLPRDAIHNVRLPS
jgi:hypothetical protein